MTSPNVPDDATQLEHNPFGSLPTTYGRCMLCGADIALSPGEEHVFAKWLQHEFALWDAKVVLLNGTSIPYRNLVVPCCTSCNTACLSKLEEAVCEAFRQSPSAFMALDERILFLWVAKMFFGLLYKELSLPLDRASPSKDTIVTEDLLRAFTAFHHLLQSARTSTSYSAGKPWSLFLARVRLRDGEEFYFHDNVDQVCFMMRLGGVGVIASLYDNGATGHYWRELYERTRGTTLEPIQFDELAAMVFYARRLLNRTPKTVTVWHDSEAPKPQVFSLPYMGFSAKPIFDEWNPRHYAAILHPFMSKWGFRFEDLYKPPNQVLSWIYGPNDEVRFG
jgi:hypothetical protein